MPTSGYTGISYPFRISNQGKTVMSSTGRYDPTHINESIDQILRTRPSERSMENQIYSNIDTNLFEPNDVDLQTTLKMQIAEDLQRLEDRIEVNENGIELSVEVDSNGQESLYATITYEMIDFETYYTTKVNLGEVT